MPVLEAKGRIASRSEAKNVVVPVMYRQHALSADRSHIFTPIIATRTLRNGMFAQGPRPPLIPISWVYMLIHRAAANDVALCRQPPTDLDFRTAATRCIACVA